MNLQIVSCQDSLLVDWPVTYAAVSVGGGSSYLLRQRTSRSLFLDQRINRLKPEYHCGEIDIQMTVFQWLLGESEVIIQSLG